MLDSTIIYSLQFVENPKLCYRIKPLGGKDINSEGFRGREFSIKKDINTIRIIMLGDSITFGALVRRDETFSEVVEKMLNERSRSLSLPLTYEIMNFGVGGYNIVSEIEALKEYGLKYKPDIVILNYFWNDNKMYSYDYWSFLRREDVGLAEKNWAYQYYLKPDRFRWQRILFRSHLYVFLWACVNQFRKTWLEFKDVEYLKYENNIILEKLSELKKMAQEHHFKILICMHPILDYDKNRPNPNSSKTKKISEELGIPCMDLIAYYKQESSDPGVFLVKERDVYHPNAKGHALIARSIVSELTKIGYL